MVSRRIWGYRAANRLIYTGYLSFCRCSSFVHLVFTPIYRNHRATKIIVMESCRAHTIIAGTSFALLITALRDDVELPEELPETIPSAWLDNLDRYRIVLLLSTSKHGPKAIAGTAAEYELKIERRDSARYFVNIPASATEEMEEGEIVLTVELHDTQTDTVMKAERRTVPLVKARL